MLAFISLPVATVAAQGMSEMFSGFSSNSGKEINITADSLEVDDSRNTATFRGNVKVVQGDVTLNTAILKVDYIESANGSSQEIDQMEASGSVVVSSGSNTLTGDRALFEMLRQFITVTGNVVISQGDNVLRGSKLVINLIENTTHLEGGRVQGSFMPRRAN